MNKLKTSNYSIKIVKNELLKCKIDFIENIYGNKISWIKTGGLIKCLIQPDSEKKILKTLRILKAANVEYKVVGNTSNVLLLDEKIYDFIIQTKKLKDIQLYNGTLQVGSGVLMPKLFEFALQNNIEGFESIQGIPGTVGGGIYMNAEAFGDGITDYLETVKYISEDLEIKEINRDKLRLKYRQTIFQNIKGIIISAKFRCKFGQTIQIKQKAKALKERRLKILESKYSNLGSNFATKDIYLEIARENHWYRLILKVLRSKIIKNYLNNSKLNKFTLFFFGWDPDLPISEKTLNSFKKKDNNTSNDLIKLLNEIKKVTNKNLRQEIQIF